MTTGTKAARAAKRKNSHIKRALLVQAVVILMGVILFMLSLKPIKIGWDLFWISDNILLIEQYGDWDEADHEQYNRMLDAREEIKESSTVGRLMVEAGASALTQAIRMFILIGLVVMDICIIAMICYIFRMDFEYIWKKLF